jgi:glycosyltransferase involved in cell wall biosynthesis
MTGGRVLMIAHHFPPAGGSGSNRALAFARYLPECGWQPVVLTPGEAWAMNRDDRLVGEVPADVRVIRTRSWEPRHPPLPLGEAARSASEGALSAANGRSRTAPSPQPSLRGRGSLRSHLGHLKRFPDAHLGWLPFALGAARRVSFDVAYSSSGPFTSHLVGLALKRLTGRAWVAELRDGWYRWNRAIFPDYPVWRDRLERRLEALALQSSDRVVLVTDRMAAAFRCQYPDLPPEYFAVVPNGFDPAQFATTGEPGPEHPGWNVVHAGALYYGRSLATFLEAVARVAAADANFAHAFRLTLIGTLDASARAELSQRAAATRVQIRGQLDHASTIEAMRSADALLLVANTTPGAEATVPGKLFEYLAIGRPVLAVAPRDSSTADVLEQTGCGWLAPAGEPEAIASVLVQAFYDRSRRADPRQVARFDRRVLAGDLARLFDQAVERAARRA